MSESAIFPYPEHWELTTLGQLCIDGGGGIQTGPFGSQLHSADYVEVGIPSIMPKNISIEGVSTEDIARITEEDALRLSKYLVKEGDIVYSRRGDVEKCSLITKREDGWLCGTGCLKVSLGENSKVPSDYIHAYLSHPAIREWISRHAVGATMPNLNTSILSAVPVLIPSKNEIGTVIDIWRNTTDKTILNRQTNQTLEQIAQAIFKSWFVDFEPTRAKIIAKAQGADPATQELAAQAIICGAITLEQLAEVEHNLATTLQQAIDKKLNQHNQTNPTALNAQQLKTTAALFPNELVESVLGDVPEGWEVKALDEIAHYQNGLALQKFRPEDDEESLPVLKIAQLRKGFADGEERASANIKPECIVDNGDVVFSWSGSLIVDIWCGGKVALNQHLFKVTSQNYPKWFYHYWTKRHLEVFQQIAADKAVTMGHIKREHLSQAKCLVPADNLLELGVINNLLEKQVLLNLENFSLENIRDALLPKLLSGELRVNSGSHIT